MVLGRIWSVPCIGEEVCQDCRSSGLQLLSRLGVLSTLVSVRLCGGEEDNDSRTQDAAGACEVKVVK